MAPTAKTKWLEEWNARLRHSHRVWMANGMTSGDSTHSAEPTATEGRQEVNILRYLDAYRGAMWPAGSWGKIPNTELQEVNLVFSTVNTLVARNSARAPQVYVAARGAELAKEDAAQRAVLKQAVLRNFVHELKMKREVDRAIHDAGLVHFGVLIHGYTAPDEKFDKDGRLLQNYDPARADAPFIRRKPVWDVRFDPNAESWDNDGDCSWFAYRDLFTKDQIEGNPGMKLPKGLKPTVSRDKRRIQERSDGTALSEDFNQFYEVWTVFDKVRRTWFQIIEDAPKPIRDEADWPIPWPSLPYTILMFNRQSDTPVPVPFTKIYWKLQMELNKVHTIVMELVKRTRRLIGINKDQMDENKRDILNDLDLTEMIEFEGDPAAAMKEIKSGGMPQELLFLIQKLEQDIRSIVGVSDMDRGQRINVDTATEAQGVREGSQTQAGRNQEKVEEFWSSVLKNFDVGLQTVQTEDLLVPIIGSDLMATVLGEDGQPQAQASFARVPPSILEGDFTYGVKPGSTLTEDPASDAREVVAMVAALNELYANPNTPLKLDDGAKEIIRAFRRDTKRWLQTPVESQQTEDALTAKGFSPEQAPPAGGGGGVSPQLLSSLQGGGQ